MDFYSEITGLILSKKIQSKEELHRAKIKLCKKYKIDNIPPDYEILANLPSDFSEEERDIAVAEVGLPPSLLNSNDREVLLKEYSIKNVLTQEINDWFMETFGIKPDSADLAAYLGNTDAPGYFNEDGFIQGGEAPGEEYLRYEERTTHLTPYNPADINTLEIVFKY